MNSTQLKAIEAEISRCLDTDFSIDDCTAIHGGDINQSFRINSRNRLFFLKSNRIGHLPLLKSEARSLTEISRSGAIKVPSPICCGQTDSLGFLLLEFLDLSASRRNSAALGQALANMHRQSSEHFGWPENNFIGHTPQQNPRKTDWVDFWRTDRLGFQAELAAKNHCPGKTLDLIERVRQVTAEFFKNYQPAPALLHGDLWAGNAGFLADGTPVIFDPACYYGDRESDIAMTELFGGFDEEFYRAYNTSWPLDEGYAVRKYLYQLYHVINHFNLFGGSYAAQAHRLCTEILRYN